MPEILPVVMTTHGEMGLGTIRMQELLTAAYKRRIMAEGKRSDGLNPTSLSASFRNLFRDLIQVAVARGTGYMLCEAGQLLPGPRLT